MSWHYYEAHVTIEPIFDADRAAVLTALSEAFEFRLAKLFMQQPEGLTPNDLNAFTSARDPDLIALQRRMKMFLAALMDSGFQVYRYKIESTLIDSRHDQAFHSLEWANSVAKESSEPEIS